jgi:peptidoglycan-associated lipoprotein
MKKFLFLMFAALLFSFSACRKAVDTPDYKTAAASAVQEAPPVYEDLGTASEEEEPSLRDTVHEKNINLKTVNFAFDSSDLSEGMLNILKENAAFLKANPNANIVVEGHTDERGTTQYNLALGQRRAVRVKEYYVQLGVASKRIATISYGEEMPVDTRQNEAGFTRNRRAETKVME